MNGRMKQRFEELCEMQPQLRDLYEIASAIKDDLSTPAFCANAVWYGYGSWRGLGIKELLKSYVGWGADLAHSAALKTSCAYDIAYEVIYDALPDCRNCGCGP